MDIINSIVQVRSEASQVCKCALINPTTSVQYFDFSTTSSYFFVTDLQTDSTRLRLSKDGGAWISVKPQGSIKVWPILVINIVVNMVIEFSVLSSFASNFLSLQMISLKKILAILPNAALMENYKSSFLLGLHRYYIATYA